jgi:hypothetical protein
MQKILLIFGLIIFLIINQSSAWCTEITTKNFTGQQIYNSPDGTLPFWHPSGAPDSGYGINSPDGTLPFWHPSGTPDSEYRINSPKGAPVSFKEEQTNEVYFKTYKLENFPVEKIKPYQLAGSLEKSKENSLLWLTSIIIPGLGQALMGDILRGLAFTSLIVSLVSFWGISRAVNLTFLLTSFFAGRPTESPFNFVEVFIGLSIAMVYIWNIFDAYFYSFNPGDTEDYYIETAVIPGPKEYLLHQGLLSVNF